MSTVSLTAAIKTPKVTTGLASNLQSERSLNQNYIINPNRALYDDYVREANIDSIDALTVGYDPMYRIDVEDSLRPQYSEYLDVPQGIQGVTADEDALVVRKDFYKGGSDTRGVGMYTNLGFAPQYKINSTLRPAFSTLDPADQEFLVEQQMYTQKMDRVYATPRYTYRG